MKGIQVKSSQNTGLGNREMTDYEKAKIFTHEIKSLHQELLNAI